MADVQHTDPRPVTVVDTAVHPALQSAFDGLDEAGIRWALVRGSDDLRRPTGDVDLLVDARALDGLDEVVAAAGLRRVAAAGHASHRFYYAYDAGSDLWLKLDIVSAVGFGPFQDLSSPLAAGCLLRRRRDGRLWRLAPEDEAWLLLLHLLLDKGGIARPRAASAAAAAAAATSTDPVAEFLDDHLGAGTAAEILRTVRDRQPGPVAAVAADLRRRWVRRRPLRARSRALVARVSRRVAVPAGGPRPGGLLVAVMGPDGAGKTTLSDGVTADFPVPTRAVYMGMWREGRWDRQLQRVPGGRLGQTLTRVARSSSAARYHQRRGRLVILDRFVYDVLLPGDKDSSIGGRIAAAAMLRVAPTPQLLLVLDAPAETMFARKGEHSVQVLAERRLGYLAIAERFPPSVVIDATMSADDVRRRALQVIWDRFAGAAPTAGDPCRRPTVVDA